MMQPSGSTAETNNPRANWHRPSYRQEPRWPWHVAAAPSYKAGAPGAGGGGGFTAQVGGIKGSFGFWCRFELLASWSCFVERTTLNKLVNGKFTAPACGPIKPGDGEDDENDCNFARVCVCVCVRTAGMRRGCTE